MGKARNGDATPNRQIHGTVKKIVGAPQLYRSPVYNTTPPTKKPVAGPHDFSLTVSLFPTLPSRGNAPCCVKESALNVKRWGVVVAVVAAVKEEVGKIEDGEIATEGGANVITREKGSGG